MAPKRPPSSERWTIDLPQKASRPRGASACAEQAVAQLGPFTHKRQEDAKRACSGKVRFAISEQLAFEHVKMLAQDFNAQEYLARGAPRQKGIVEQLTKTEELASEFASHLKSLDDFTRHQLQTAGSGVNGFEIPLMNDADVRSLPLPGGSANLGDHGRWVKALDALSRYATESLGNFLRSKGIDSVDVLDKGGARDVYKDLYGSPRWSLVHQGWYTYELFKPDTATGTEGGPFHQFLMAVFEYATAKEPEEHAKLSYWLKSVVKTNRQYKKVLARERKLENELDDLIDNRRSDLGPEARKKRRGELAAELAEANRESSRLWDKLYPHAYRGNSGSEPTAGS